MREQSEGEDDDHEEGEGGIVDVFGRKESPVPVRSVHDARAMAVQLQKEKYAGREDMLEMEVEEEERFLRGFSPDVGSSSPVAPLKLNNRITAKLSATTVIQATRADDYDELDVRYLALLLFLPQLILPFLASQSQYSLVRKESAQLSIQYKTSERDDLQVAGVNGSRGGQAMCVSYIELLATPILISPLLSTAQASGRTVPSLRQRRTAARRPRRRRRRSAQRRAGWRISARAALLRLSDFHIVSFISFLSCGPLVLQSVVFATHLIASTQASPSSRNGFRFQRVAKGVCGLDSRQARQRTHSRSARLVGELTTTSDFDRGDLRNSTLQATPLHYCPSSCTFLSSSEQSSMRQSPGMPSSTVPSAFTSSFPSWSLR